MKNKTVKVKIGEEFLLHHDGLQWCLQTLVGKAGEEVKSVKTGKTTIRTEDVYSASLYFYSLDQVAKRIVNQLGTSDSKDMKELISTYRTFIRVVTGKLSVDTKGQDSPPSVPPSALPSAPPPSARPK